MDAGYSSTGLEPVLGIQDKAQLALAEFLLHAPNTVKTTAVASSKDQVLAWLLEPACLDIGVGTHTVGKLQSFRTAVNTAHAVVQTLVAQARTAFGVPEPSTLATELFWFRVRQQHEAQPRSRVALLRPGDTTVRKSVLTKLEQRANALESSTVGLQGLLERGGSRLGRGGRSIRKYLMQEVMALCPSIGAERAPHRELLRVQPHAAGVSGRQRRAR